MCVFPKRGHCHKLNHFANFARAARIAVLIWIERGGGQYPNSQAFRLFFSFFLKVYINIFRLMTQRG